MNADLRKTDLLNKVRCNNIFHRATLMKMIEWHMDLKMEVSALQLANGISGDIDPKTNKCLAKITDAIRKLQATIDLIDDMEQSVCDIYHDSDYESMKKRCKEVNRLAEYMTNSHERGYEVTL